MKGSERRRQDSERQCLTCTTDSGQPSMPCRIAAATDSQWLRSSASAAASAADCPAPSKGLAKLTASFSAFFTAAAARRFSLASRRVAAPLSRPSPLVDSGPGSAPTPTPGSGSAPGSGSGSGSGFCFCCCCCCFCSCCCCCCCCSRAGAGSGARAGLSVSGRATARPTGCAAAPDAVFTADLGNAVAVTWAARRQTSELPGSFCTARGALPSAGYLCIIGLPGDLLQQNRGERR